VVSRISEQSSASDGPHVTVRATSISLALGIDWLRQKISWPSKRNTYANAKGAHLLWNFEVWRQGKWKITQTSKSLREFPQLEIFLAQRRKGAKKTLRHAVALCALRERSLPVNSWRGGVGFLAL
jgi:hypothetical protein